MGITGWQLSLLSSKTMQPEFIAELEKESMVNATAQGSIAWMT